MAFFQNGLDGGGGDGGGGGGGGGGGSITTLNIFSAAVVNGPPNPISMGASETSGLYAAFDEELGIVVSMENTMVFQGVRGAYNANSDQEWQDAQFPVPNPNYWLNTFGIDASEYELYANSNFEPEPLSDATPHSLQQFLDNEYYGGEYGTTTQRQSVFDPTMYNFATFGVVQTLDLIYNFDGTGLIINGEALEIAIYLADNYPSSWGDAAGTYLELNAPNVGPHKMSEFGGRCPYDPEAIFGSGGGPDDPGGENPSDFEGGFSWSDRRLKYDIKLVGKSLSGINIYNFKYKDKKIGKGIYQGVMSDEIPQYAVKKHSNGYDKVNYSMLDVKFKKINN